MYEDTQWIICFLKHREKLNKRLEEYDKLFGEQERKEQQELKEWSKKFRQRIRFLFSLG